MLNFGQCYHGMVRYDNCTTDVPKRPANAGQVVVELFFNKHTCEAGDDKPAPEIWVMDLNKVRRCYAILSPWGLDPNFEPPSMPSSVHTATAVMARPDPSHQKPQ